MTETLGDVLKVGGEAAMESANIGVKLLGAAPQVIEESVSLAHGVGKTIQETSGQVRQVLGG